MTTKSPIIGLTTYGRHETKVSDDTYYDQYYAAPVDYVDSIRRAGGVPILLPPGETNWKRWLDITDGIVISGGADVNPDRYAGNADHPELTEIDPERDATELALAKHIAEQKKQPTLCICRGFQVLNIALGGTLHEHIPDLKELDIHRNDTGGWTIQEVSATPDSLLAQAMGNTAVHTYSGHHQAIDQVAAGLTISALAPDGIIESLEMDDHPWLLAVQWHPEKSTTQDPSQQNIFDTLIAQAKK